MRQIVRLSSLAAAGWATLTVSLGTARTLRRIHSRKDDLETLRGAGIDRAARVLARAAMDLAPTAPPVQDR